MRSNNLFYGICTLFVIFLFGLLIFKPSKLRVIEKIQTEEEIEYKEFLDSIMKEEMEEEKDYEEAISKVYKGKRRKVIVTITKYNPEREQCDEDFLITADNSKIDLEKLNSGKLRWIAVSRDLRKHFPYGSKVIIHSDDPELRGIWEVHDTMNEKWSSRIDLLSPIGDTKGKWVNMKISSL